MPDSVSGEQQKSLPCDPVADLLRPISDEEFVSLRFPTPMELEAAWRRLDDAARYPRWHLPGRSRY